MTMRRLFAATGALAIVGVAVAFRTWSVDRHSGFAGHLRDQPGAKAGVTLADGTSVPLQVGRLSPPHQVRIRDKGAAFDQGDPLDVLDMLQSTAANDPVGHLALLDAKMRAARLKLDKEKSGALMRPGPPPSDIVFRFTHWVEVQQRRTTYRMFFGELRQGEDTFPGISMTLKRTPKGWVQTSDLDFTPLADAVGVATYDDLVASAGK